MKINNKKIIVSTLALAMGAALAGSISGSVAWYQYSTRAAATVSGTSAGTSRNLQVKVGDGSYTQYLDSAAILAKASKGSDGNLLPVGAVVDSTANTVTSFVGNPVYQYETLPAIDKGYIEYTLSFKCEDTTTSGTAQVAKNVFLTTLNVTLAEEKLLPAVRIAISDGTNSYILASAAGDTATQGNLDLNGNGVKDTNEFDQQDAGSTKITYKTPSGTGYQEEYVATAWSSLVTSFGTDPYTEPTGASPITTTLASGDAEVNVKIWLEGWADVDSKNCWDLATALNKSVQVDMRFECKADAQ